MAETTNFMSNRDMITIHELASQDAIGVREMRKRVAGQKGVIIGPEARPMFDEMLASVTPSTNIVQYAPGAVGGVQGWWCHPANAKSRARLLFLHGGCYVLGSAFAVRHFSGQFAARTGISTFAPDYRLAPENPFPAALDDALAAYHGLAQEAEAVVVVGDSAGGGLTLALIALLVGGAGVPETLSPAGAAVMSPWTDLALKGASMDSRAEVDPLFTKGVLAAVAELYLQGCDPIDSRASPLYGVFPTTLPPIRIDVGDDEILLDDAVSYAQRARDAGIDVALHIWKGMPHVFQASVGKYLAAEQSMNQMADFLRKCIEAVVR